MVMSGQVLDSWHRLLARFLGGDEDIGGFVAIGF